MSLAGVTLTEYPSGEEKPALPPWTGKQPDLVALCICGYWLFSHLVMLWMVLLCKIISTLSFQCNNVLLHFFFTWNAPCTFCMCICLYVCVYGCVSVFLCVHLNVCIDAQVFMNMCQDAQVFIYINNIHLYVCMLIWSAWFFLIIFQNTKGQASNQSILSNIQDTDMIWN